jgi:hypothetical protein
LRISLPNRYLTALAALFATASLGLAQSQVTALNVAHRSGQSFLTWSELPSNQGESYRVYRSSTPLNNASQLANAELLIELPRGSGQHPDLQQGYVIQQGGSPLPADTGLLVVTAPSLGARYYAVTTVVGGTENQTLSNQNSSGQVPEIPAPPRPILQITTDKGRDRHFVHFASSVTTAYVKAQAGLYGRVFDYRVWVDTSFPGPRPVLVFLHPKGTSYRTWPTMDWAPANAVQIFCDDKNVPTGHDFWLGYHEDYPSAPGPSTVVVDYSERRLLWTIDQVLGDLSLSCDSSRVSAIGASLGAIAAVGLATRHPDVFAACGGLLPAFSFTHNDFALVAETAALYGTPQQALASSIGPSIYDVFDAISRIAERRGSGVAPMRFTFGRADTITGWEDKPPFIQAAKQARLPVQCYWDMRAHSSLGSWSTLEGTLFAELMEIRLDRPYAALSNVSNDDDPGPGNRFVGDLVGTTGGYTRFDPSTASETGSKLRVDVALTDDPNRLDHAPSNRAFADLTFRRVRSFPILPGQYYLAPQPRSPQPESRRRARAQPRQLRPIDHDATRARAPLAKHRSAAHQSDAPGDPLQRHAGSRRHPRHAAARRAAEFGHDVHRRRPDLAAHALG